MMTSSRGSSWLFALLTLMLLAMPLSAQNRPDDPPVIVTQGEATLKRPTDQAWIRVAAEARAPRSGEAERKAAEAMTTLQAALKAAGVPADAIKTVSFSLQPEMDYSGGTPKLKDYVVNNQVEVRVDALDKMGSILDAAGSSGATTISGLRFDVKDRDTVEREALKQAVQDAMARAQAMAAGAGRSLGNIVRIEEQRAAGPVLQQQFMRMAGRAGAAPETPVNPGETDIRAQVTVTVMIR